MYAVYQAGQAIYGVGETVAEAMHEAAQWLDDAPGAREVTTLGTTGPQGEVGGNLYARSCTARLAQEVQEYGGDVRFTINEDGLLDLDREP